MKVEEVWYMVAGLVGVSPWDERDGRASRD